MGYTTGRKWTDEDVEIEIFKVMNSLNITRMPSKSECELVINNSSLTNRIAKTGGFYKWAERLNLEVKPSDTKTGLGKEIEIQEFIQSEMNLKAELTPYKFPYDILVGKSVKIDVKFSRGYDYSNGYYHSFNLEYDMPKSDVMILVCGDVKTLVIPSHELLGIKQVSVGKESKYDVYIDNWECIRLLSNFHHELGIYE